jgi:predicted O-linked N-acetylglucosamine transferase (SPINDLY family)
MAFSSTADLLEEARALHRRGTLVDAAARYAEVLRRDPDNSDAYYYLGMMACQDGRFAEGAELAHKSLANNPRSARALVLLGRALSALGRLQEALPWFERAIALEPELAQAHASRADTLSDLGRTVEAVESYDRALHLAPDTVEDWFNRGLALCALRRLEEAVVSFDRAIERRPNLVRARLQRSRVLSDLRRHDEALADLDEALHVDASLAEAWLGRASVLKELKRYEESFSACERALTINPDYAEAMLCRGNLLFEIKQYDEALAACDQALALKPNSVEAWFGRGTVLFTRKKYEDALVAYDKVLEIHPDFAEASIGRGNVFVERQQYHEALAAYDRAASLRPDLAEAWAGRGNVLAELQRYDEALAACNRATSLKPELAEAWLGRGNVFFNRKQHGAALSAYERALSLRADLAEGWLGRGNLLFAKLNVCDWTALEADTQQLLSRVRQEERASMAFALLPITSTAADQFQSAVRYVRDLPLFPPLCRDTAYSHDRIRIAYLSADFREHPVAYLAAGLFEHHDRSRFDVTGLSFGTAQNSAIRSRIESSFDRFIDVGRQIDAEVARLIHQLEIDIVVDLMGHTQNARLGILARRPAPIQIHYLGYAGTTGANFVDYLIADSTVIPEEHRAFYTEQVVWLPDSYLASDDKRAISTRTPTRQECGLPENGFVFCSFNNAYKIGPKMFQLWMRLLRAVPNSLLWLSQADPLAMMNLGREAERYGVPAQRLIFAPKVAEISDHLARQRQADLFLDTLPYNAHTTASDALWAGLPVLTCLGETFAGRVAASQLRAVGLPELITASLEEYETLALKLAREPKLLASIRAKLARNRDSMPLFDTVRFTRHLEAAYEIMWRTHRDGHPPAPFSVAAESDADGLRRKQAPAPQPSGGRWQ